MIDNTFAREERVLSLKRAYYDKFKAKLTPQQLVTLFCSKPNRGTAPGRQQLGVDRAVCARVASLVVHKAA